MSVLVYDKPQLRTILDSDFVMNPDAFKPGRRNDDAVDLSIICWCLNLEPYTVLLAIEKEQGGWSINDWRGIEEHMNRVKPYLDGWGTRGTMEAMAKAINY